MSEELAIIEVSCEPIELYKVLKIANMVSGGGEAKIVISEGYVFLNGEVEFQKRKKVYQDDIVEFNGEAFQVNIVESLHQENVTIAPQNLSKAKSPSNNGKNKGQKKAKSANNKNSSSVTPFSKEINSGKRKPISF